MPDADNQQMIEEKFPGFVGKSYIGTTEVARIMGVSKQRVCQLHHENPTFPIPKVRISGVYGWTADQIVRYDATRNKVVGRPKVSA
jgi:hypothetical protein